MLTDPNTTKYLSSIELGKEGDATSLENMKASLKYIRECNDLRAKEGLPPAEGIRRAHGHVAGRCRLVG